MLEKYLGIKLGSKDTSPASRNAYRPPVPVKTPAHGPSAPRNDFPSAQSLGLPSSGGGDFSAGTGGVS